jgi:hypothetical protein
MQESSMGMRGTLDAVKLPRPHNVKSYNLPFGKGRVMFTKDRGVSTHMANEYLLTNLTAVHRDGDGKLKDVRDIGSGVVTQVAVLSLANDWNWAAPSGTLTNTIAQANYHAVGTGTAAASQNNIALETLASPTTTTAVTGTQSLVSTASVSTYVTQATTSFSGSEAITEWGLFSQATLSSTLGSPFTSGAATSASVTGAPFTASSSTVLGQQQTVFEDLTAATPFWGLCTSNTTGDISVPGWYTTATGALSGVDPVNADTYQILPVMFDRQVFAALNVENGDSILWVFKLQIVAGG